LALVYLYRDSKKGEEFSLV